jgi:hypothetical protein
MRSTLDHVQSPDLALLEAKWVLKRDGRLVIGLYVDGGKTGKRTFDRKLKETVRSGLTSIGMERFKDHHTLHPTFANIHRQRIRDSGRLLAVHGRIRFAMLRRVHFI